MADRSGAMSERYILDGTKIAYHTDRVEAWEAGERIAPVTIDMALTRACQASCRGCYAMLQEPGERANITHDAAMQFLDDAAEMGVRGLSLISDGESTLSKAYVPFIKGAVERGMSVGNATNGWRLTPEVSEEVLPLFDWVRFTVLAGTREDFNRMMHHDPENTDAWEVMQENVRYAVALKERDNLAVTLGIQTFVTPDDGQKIRDFAQLGIDLGVDYAVIKHTSDDEARTMGVEYERYPEIYAALHEAETMSNDTTQVIVKWSKIKTGDKPSYKRMYATPFLLQISGSGLVAPTGMLFNRQYAAYHIGNYVDEPFIDIWRSDRYWDVMNALASDQFDAAKHMGALAIQHYTNVALDNHVKGIKRIEAATGDVPHRNFL